jgi:hypothetical protein
MQLARATTRDAQPARGPGTAEGVVGALSARSVGWFWAAP